MMMMMMLMMIIIINFLTFCLTGFMVSCEVNMITQLKDIKLKLLKSTKRNGIRLGVCFV
jgi:hypothetical protein